MEWGCTPALRRSGPTIHFGHLLIYILCGCPKTATIPCDTGGSICQVPSGSHSRMVGVQGESAEKCSRVDLSDLLKSLTLNIDAEDLARLATRVRKPTRPQATPSGWSRPSTSTDTCVSLFRTGISSPHLNRDSTAENDHDARNHAC